MNSPPSTLGQYQIIREIARSNDIVYEAYDPLMNRRVAIKELAMPQGASGPQQEERISRFKREAQAAGTLNHPNIMTVFTFAEDAGRTFMAMEYLDGGTLRNEIDTKGFIPVDRAVEIATNILEGLAHAHSKGVIHRDIKPDNIQILANGTIKITDFGIARLTFQPNLTMDGQVFGTPSYMSPEQVVGKDIDQRSDLFSVGVVLYEMIAGQKPFSGDSVVSITYSIMNAEAPQPQQAPYAIWKVIAKALDKSPQLRYSNADEMIQALKDAESATHQGATGASSNSQSTVYGANPYMTPPPIPQPPPLPVYSYNPYQAHPTMAPPSPYQNAQYNQPSYPYQAGPSMQPPAAFPIYYPPPPRGPLFKAESVAFWRRLIVAFLILGTLVVLILVGINAIVSAAENARMDGMDNGKLPVSLANIPANVPFDQRVQIWNKELGNPHSVGTTAQIKHGLAMMYDGHGRRFLETAQLVNAETEYATGLQYESNNSSLLADMGQLYSIEADREDDMDKRGVDWENSANKYSDAARYETNSNERFKLGKEAARIALKYGQYVLDKGQRDLFSGARDLLYGVQDVVAEDHDLGPQVKDMLSRLS